MLNRRFDISALKDTQRLASHLALQARIGDVLALKGDLGSGKTAFARFFIQACTSAVQEVPSPTFTLLQLYEGKKFPIYHFDLYRLKAEREIFELGIEEAFSQGVSLIEWPERIENMDLPDCLTIEFSLKERRIVTLVPDNTWISRLSINYEMSS